MAMHADDLRRELAESLRLLGSFPGRFEFAARLALICALTTLIVEICQTPDPALTAYFAFFVMKPDRMTSMVLSIFTMLLVSLIIGAVILITIVVIDQPGWRVASMAVLSFVLLFMTSASKLRPIGGTIALIVAYALDLLGNAQIGEIATRALLYAWLFVAIPAGVSVAVNLLLGPPPRRLVEGALAHRLTLAAAILRAPGSHIRHKFTEAMSEGAGEIQTWLKRAAAEKTSPAQDIAALRRASESITPILLLIDIMDRNPEGALPKLLKYRIAQVLDDMASVLRDGGYPIEIALENERPDLLSPTAAAILADLREALACFTEAPRPDLPPLQAKKAPGGFFLPDGFTNPEHVYYAIKTTAAAMTCYVVYMLLDWPGIHTCLMTCYIVSLGTTGETVEKLTLRILGCILGAAAGIAAIVFLIPSVTSIGVLMIVVFLAAFVSGWVAAGSPRISYAGFQIALAFFLCVIQGSAPTFDLTIARDRIIGILFGNLVVYLVFTNTWPTSVAQRVDPAIGSLLRRLSQMMLAANRSRRFSLASDASAALGVIKQDLHLARYERPSLHPAEDWLDTRRQAAAEIAALTGSLFLRSNLDPAPGSDISRRLNGLADRLGGHPESSALPTDKAVTFDGRSRQDGSASASYPIEGPIAAHLQRLERTLVPHPAEEGAASYAPA
jgi:multidrug resistance protein MdtO